ncbi:MAG TPA: BglII/BstYI family type II restriction endonuclease [Gammaproteobacteria bacterium]|nr:BglII/BstYI family type II restriction endonuclease [Gammaproteobacteria bacterium]
MSTERLVPEDLRELYHVKEWRNAAGVLSTACPEEWANIIEVLRNFRLLRSEILTAGGALSPISKQVNGAFARLGWLEKKFATRIVVDDTEYVSPTHLVDCFKGRVAVELEWNNKDPFYDRDLNNFRLLFDLRAIDVGVILTRATELHALFKELGKKMGPSTTHHEKLWPRLDGGGGGGCPVLTFAITRHLYVDDGDEAVAAALEAVRLRKEAAKKKKARGAARVVQPEEDEEEDEEV